MTSHIMCNSCLHLPVAVSSPPTHPSLERINSYTACNERHAEAIYQCARCKTKWLHRKSKWGECEGYRLHP